MNLDMLSFAAKALQSDFVSQCT